MMNYVISAEQTRVFSEYAEHIGFLLKEKNLQAVDIVSQKFYLHQNGEWTIFSGRNASHPAPFSLDLILTEFACHKMGGWNIGLMSIKNQEKFNELFADFIGLMKVDEEYLKGNLLDSE